MDCIARRNQRVYFVCGVVVLVLGSLALKRGVFLTGLILRGDAKTDADIADLFAYSRQKYNIQAGVVYDCFSRNVTENHGVLNSVVDFVSDIKDTGNEDTERQGQFQKIYDLQKWTQHIKGKVKDKMSAEYMASGDGSTLEAAQAPLALLNLVIERLKMYLNKPVISIVDIPCGDFIWMRELVRRRDDVNYTGIDIVPTLIERHQKNYGNLKNAKFVHMDIVKQELGEAYDVIFCRDMLMHLPDAAVMQVLGHFSSSGSKVLVTTLLKGKNYKDIQAGDYRPLDLKLPPVNLTPPICEIADTHLNELKYLGVWTLPLKQQH